MEFDINRVYTAKDADEVKIGSKVVVANSMKDLREKVEFAERCTVTLSDVDTDDYLKRFVAIGDNFGLCYLISELEEKKLKWTDLKIGDVLKKKSENEIVLVAGIREKTATNEHILLSYWTSDEELAEVWEKVEE